MADFDCIWKPGSRTHKYCDQNSPALKISIHWNNFPLLQVQEKWKKIRVEAREVKKIFDVELEVESWL